MGSFDVSVCMFVCENRVKGQCKCPCEYRVKGQIKIKGQYKYVFVRVQVKCQIICSLVPYLALP